MTPRQLELIPDHLLVPRSQGCTALMRWLGDRGWAMSLAELANERTRRGIVRR